MSLDLITKLSLTQTLSAFKRAFYWTILFQIFFQHSLIAVKRFEVSGVEPADQRGAPAASIQTTNDDLRGGSSPPDKQSPPYPAFHLPHSMSMTDAEHIGWLLSEIPKATDHILISSWGVNEGKLRTCGVHALLRQARQRGVRIYVYIGGQHNGRTESYVRSIATQYSFIPIHTKIFAVDMNFVALGSFNWLSPFGKEPIEKRKNENGTFVYKDCVSNTIKDVVWEKIKLFKSLYHNNARAVKKGSSKRSFFRSVPIGNSREVRLLGTGECHINYLDQQIQKAKHKVVLTSYSVTDNIDSKIPDKLIQQALERGVQFYFITNGKKNCQKLQQHFAYFSNGQPLTSLTVLNHPSLHAKTWIFDDKTIVQTSYNLFSAAPRVRHDLFEDWSFNCESGLAVTGDAAKPFIQKYYRDSLLGIVIQGSMLGDLGEELVAGEPEVPQIGGATSTSPTHPSKKRKREGPANSTHCEEDDDEKPCKKSKRNTSPA